MSCSTIVLLLWYNVTCCNINIFVQVLMCFCSVKCLLWPFRSDEEDMRKCPPDKYSESKSKFHVHPFLYIFLAADVSMSHADICCGCHSVTWTIAHCLISVIVAVH